MMKAKAYGIFEWKWNVNIYVKEIIGNKINEGRRINGVKKKIRMRPSTDIIFDITWAGC
jgi:hypothetical protein